MPLCRGVLVRGGDDLFGSKQTADSVEEVSQRSPATMTGFRNLDDTAIEQVHRGQVASAETARVEANKVPPIENVTHRLGRMTDVGPSGGFVGRRRDRFKMFPVPD